MAIANRLISKPVQVACSNVILHLLVPVRFIKRLEPSPELGPLGRWQLLNCSLNLSKGLMNPMIAESFRRAVAST